MKKPSAFAEFFITRHYTCAAIHARDIPFIFLGITFMKHAFSHPLQSVHSCILAASARSLSETGLIQPKSICISPAAQTNLHNTCLTNMEVVSMYIATPMIPAFTPNVNSQFIICDHIVLGATKYPVNAMPPSRGL